MLFNKMNIVVLLLLIFFTSILTGCSNFTLVDKQPAQKLEEKVVDTQIEEPKDSDQTTNNEEVNTAINNPVVEENQQTATPRTKRNRITKNPRGSFYRCWPG